VSWPDDGLPRFYAADEQVLDRANCHHIVSYFLTEANGIQAATRKSEAMADLLNKDPSATQADPRLAHNKATAERKAAYQETYREKKRAYDAAYRAEQKRSSALGENVRSPG
jgi:hypothetical protein